MKQENLNQSNWLEEENKRLLFLRMNIYLLK